MLVVVDANHLVYLFWHMARSKARVDTGNPDALPCPGDVLDWFLIRLDNLRDYFLGSAANLSARGISIGSVRFVSVFDSPSKCFRGRVLEDYKANRTRIPEVYESVADARGAVASSDEWIGLESPDEYEADDLIASIAAQSFEQVLIHSADKDLNQCLVPGRVGLVKKSAMVDCDPNDHGIPLGSEMHAVHFTARDFETEYGFPIARWVDYQAMVGDSADNVKGCRWVGPKTAKEILRAHPHTSLYDVDPAELPLNKRQREAWADFIEQLDVLQFVFELNKQIPFCLEA